MKYVNILIDILLYSIVSVLLISSIGTSVLKKPFIMTAIRSNSMYPKMQKGDMVILKRYGANDEVQIGDIVIFKVDKGSYSDKGWIAHRVIEKDKSGSFITKGDANPQTDQALGGAYAITKDEIACQIVQYGGYPLKIPYLGYIPIYMEDLNKKPLMIPLLIIIIMSMLVLGELKGKKKNKHRKKSADLPLIYFASGFVIFVIFASTMLMGSSHFNISYDVAYNNGALMGSDVGVLKKGEAFTKPLSKIENKGIFPFIATVTTNDAQISTNIGCKTVTSKKKYNVNLTINPDKIGSYKSYVHIGMYLPFLPPSFILFLARKNYLLALIMVALVPSLPLMCCPLLNRRMRTNIIKRAHHAFRRFRIGVPL